MARLDDYENVKTRKVKFRTEYPDGRIVAVAIKLDDKEAQFYVEVFKNADDQFHDLPLATGTAQEFKGEGGFANKVAWCENCEESAVGRALDNAGFAGDKCSREEMEKVRRAEKVIKAAPVKKEVKKEAEKIGAVIDKQLKNKYFGVEQLSLKQQEEKLKERWSHIQDMVKKKNIPIAKLNASMIRVGAKKPGDLGAMRMGILENEFEKMAAVSK